MFLLEHSITICVLDLANSIFALYCDRTGKQQLLTIDLEKKKNKNSFTLKIFSHNERFLQIFISALK